MPTMNQLVKRPRAKSKGTQTNIRYQRLAPEKGGVSYRKDYDAEEAELRPAKNCPR